MSTVRSSKTEGDMGESVVPKLPKWPFVAADVFLAAAAVFVFWQGGRPLSFREMLLIVCCAAAGACLSILPYLLEYRAAVLLVQSDRLTSAMQRLEGVEALAEQVNTATGRWGMIQEEADKTAKAAKSVADGMTTELKNFTTFMTKANDSEKANLRLEVEKLRRGEGEWLQVLVRMLDHVYALHQGAVKSGQPRVVDQISRFQHACCDAARRVGLTPFIAAPEETFDPAKHQWAEGNGKAPENGGLVGETVATGFTFQGRIVRPALVRMREAAKTVAEEKPEEPQLPLGT